MLVTSAMLIAAIATAPAPQAPATSIDVDATAIAVVRGDYGTGEERRARLGADYDAVQSRVDELLATVGYTVDYVEPETVAPAVVPEPVETPAVEPVQVAPADPYADVPACVFEDGSDTEGTGRMCKWDSQTMGNHQGQGVFVYRDGVLIYEVGA